jgi:hypothetical protein
MFDTLTQLGPSARLVSLLVGASVLLLGRKLFWLFVAAVGFMVGLGLAPSFTGSSSEWVIVGLALLLGVAGALLAVFIQKIAVAVAGFGLGSYGMVWLLQLFSLDPGAGMWVAALAGGIGGAILAASLLEAALIALSALVGASLIIRAAEFSPPAALVVFVGLAAVGMLVQAKAWRKD